MRRVAVHFATSSICELEEDDENEKVEEDSLIGALISLGIREQLESKTIKPIITEMRRGIHFIGHT